MLSAFFRAGPMKRFYILLSLILCICRFSGAQSAPLPSGSAKIVQFDLKGDVLGEKLLDAKFPKEMVFEGRKKISDTEFSTIWRGRSTFANRPAQFEAEFEQNGPSDNPVLDPEKAFLIRMEYAVDFDGAKNRDIFFHAILDDLTEKFGEPRRDGPAGAIWEYTAPDGKLSVLVVGNLSHDDCIRVILSYGHKDI